MWIIRHAFAIAILPGTAAILVPYWLSGRFGIAFLPPASALDWLALVLAACLFLGGIALFAGTVFLFATAGRGTLAPWDPPSRLVVRGPYRFVRNPMISGVLLVLVAEALSFRSTVLAGWAAVFALINAVYIPLVEERQLERRFGDEYRRYKRAVPRLVPTLRAWRGDSE